MRVVTVLSAVMLSACSAVDETPMWSPEPSPTLSSSNAKPNGRVVVPPRSPVPRTTRDKALPGNRYDGPQDEPSVFSNSPLTREERSSLQSVRQSLESSIGTLERRARFSDTTAAEARRLRALKARQKGVIRRLRGG